MRVCSLPILFEVNYSYSCRDRELRLLFGLGCVGKKVYAVFHLNVIIIRVFLEASFIFVPSWGVLDQSKEDNRRNHIRCFGNISNMSYIRALDMPRN